MNIVLVGAGGSGLSSLAFILKDLGIDNVIGIEPNRTQIIDELEKLGYKIISDGSYKVKASDFVIYSDARAESKEVKDALELAENNERKARYPLSYHQFIGELSKHFETIAIAGTHGKSTTTALATYTLSQLDNQLGLGILGALVPQLDNKNYWLNMKAKDDIKSIFEHILHGKQTERDESLRKKYRFVIEADEFNRHFLYLDVDHAIVLNVELDHSDVYKNEEVYFEAYHQLGNKTKKNIRVIDGEKGVERFAEGLQNDVLQRITPYPISLQHIFGKHNQKNASLVYALIANLFGRKTYEIGPDEELVAAMSAFTGLRRRMEYLKTNDNGANIYTDYGHHPTEINAVYEAFREKFPDKKIIAIVQPHQMRRVLEFWPEWIRVLKQFDKVIIYPIYAAREDIAVLLKEYKHDLLEAVTTIEGISSFLASQIDAMYIDTIEQVKEIMELALESELVVLFTAGGLDYEIRKA